jgi:hypothetical protein
LRSFIEQPYGGMQHKARNAYSSNSEDALTWSCFDALAQVSDVARRRALSDLWELAFGNRDAPEGVLNGAISVGKRYGDAESTEVDASIEGPGALLFIEAKLYSPMSAADPLKGKPHNQLERKLRVGLREAAACGGSFYFILLDIAPPEALRALAPGVTLSQAVKPGPRGFAGKWATAYWFSRYKSGSKGSLSPLKKLLTEAGFPDMAAKDMARRMGWLTWSDVFKSVLRAAVAAPNERAVLDGPGR